MKTVTLILLLLIGNPVFALPEFNTGTIKGKITDKEKNSIPFASVVLRNYKDSSIVAATLSDADGVFFLQAIKEGSYFLEISSLGYNTNKTKHISINTEQTSITIETIILNASEQLLKEVSVSANQSNIENRAGKTTINVQQNSIYTGNNLEEVLEKSPGIKVGNDGQVSINGKPGAIIMIDGKPAAYSQNDLQNLLKTIQASNIQKIEIISTPSSKFDASGNSGVINIITRKNRMDGLNGSITLNAGHGYLPKGLNAYSLELKQGKWNLSAGYSISLRKGFSNMDLKREIKNPGVPSTFIYSNTYAYFPFFNQAPKLSAEYSFNKRLSFSTVISGLMFRFKPVTTSNAGFSNPEIRNDVIMKSTSNESWNNLTLSNQLNFQIDTTGKQLIANLDHARYNYSALLNQSFVYGQDYLHPMLTYAHQYGNLNLTAVKLDYTHPLNNRLKVESGIKSSLVEANNNNYFYNGSNSNGQLDTNRTNFFNYKENINAAYINYYKEGAQFSIEAGLRGEQTRATGIQKVTGEQFTRRYFQLFPTASLTYKINSKHEFNLSGGRRIIRPDYKMLNPYRYSVDAVAYDKGNTQLKPRLSVNTDLTYTYNNSVFITLSALKAKDYISQVLHRIGGPYTLQMFENSCYYTNLSALVSYNTKLFKRINNSLTVITYFQKIDPYKQFNLPQMQVVSYALTATQSAPLWKGINLDVSERYTSKELEGFMIARYTLNLSVGLQKSFKNNKGSISLNVSDILYTQLQAAVGSNNGIIEHWSNYRDTRVASITYLYRFGHGKTIKMRRNSGLDDEKGRVGM